MRSDARFLEALIGRPALEALIAACGGMEIHIPKTPPKQGPLKCLPEPALKALVHWGGGTRLYVPQALHTRLDQRNAAIRKAYDAGESVRSLARRYRLTERWIRAILNTPSP